MEALEDTDFRELYKMLSKYWIISEEIAALLLLQFQFSVLTKINAENQAWSVD